MHEKAHLDFKLGSTMYPPDAEAEGAHEVVPGGPVPVPDLDTQPPVLVLGLEVTKRKVMIIFPPPDDCY